MSAPIENKFAEKWTLDKTIELLNNMLNILIQDETILFSGTLAVKAGIYRQLIEYLTDKFFDNEQVFDTIKKINTIIESRIVQSAMGNQINVTMSIFTLKNNYNWKDKQETELTGKDGTPLAFTFNIIETNKNDVGS